MSHAISSVKSEKSSLLSKFEPAVWIWLIVLIIGARFLLLQIAPVYLWSNDSGSYVVPALRALEGREWESDSRRGPVYSLLIYAVFRGGGDLFSLVIVQQCLLAISILLVLVSGRVLLGARSLPATLIVGSALAVYSLPTYLALLVRNETLIFLFSAVAFFGLVMGFKGRWWGFALAGVSAGLLSLTKSVFLPFPFMAAIVAFYAFRKNLKMQILMVLLILLSYALPSALHWGYRTQINPKEHPKASYAGVQLYGRVAQWTKLDGGIFPELKPVIRAKVEEYQTFEKLDNNWVIKRGIIPVIEAHEKAVTDSDARVDKICLKLAVEAIKNKPVLYAQQVVRDMWSIVWKQGRHDDEPSRKTYSQNADILRKAKPLDVMKVEQTIPLQDQIGADQTGFKPYHLLLGLGWIFNLRPGFITSICLVFLILFDRERFWIWMTAAAVWGFTIVLNSTFGRPLERYLFPAFPVFYLSMAGFWVWLSDPIRWARITAPVRGLLAFRSQNAGEPR